MAHWFCREGDTVEIRMSKDERTLEIRENHPVDPSAGSGELQRTLTVDEEEDDA